MGKPGKRRLTVDARKKSNRWWKNKQADRRALEENRQGKAAHVYLVKTSDVCRIGHTHDLGEMLKKLNKKYGPCQYIFSTYTQWVKDTEDILRDVLRSRSVGRNMYQLEAGDSARIAERLLQSRSPE
jgi:hypothetical protein